MIDLVQEIGRYAHRPPRHGETGDAVWHLQRTLASLGIPVGEPDGVVGPLTRGGWSLLWWRTQGGRLWWWESDGTTRHAHPEDTVARAQEYGVDHVVLMVNGVDDTLEGRWRRTIERSRLTETIDALRAHGIGAHICPWVTPVRRYLHAMLDDLDQIASLCDSVQWDAESPWYDVRGDVELQEASTILREACDEWGVRMGTTGYVYAPDDVMHLYDRSHYGVPQAYSQYYRGRERYVPGDMQRWAIDHWTSDQDDARDRLVMGIGAYRWARDVPGWGSTYLESMYRMLTDTVAARCDDISVWSGYWTRADDEIGDLIRLLGIHSQHLRAEL